MELYQVGDDDYMYYAYKRQDSCNVAPTSVAIEDNYYPSLPLDCPAHCRFINTSLKSTHEFRGLTTPLSVNSRPPWAKGITPRAELFEQLSFKPEGKTFKAKVFELQIPGRETIYVGFEVKEIPDTIHNEPLQLSQTDYKRCDGGFAYSVSYHGRNLLFLTARH